MAVLAGMAVAVAVACDLVSPPTRAVLLRLVGDYRAAQRVFVANVANNAPVSVLEQDVAKVQQAEAAVAQGANPEPAQVVQWLRSEAVNCRDVGLAVVVAKGMSGDAVAEAVLGTYDPADPVTLREATMAYAWSVLDTKQRQRHFELIRSMMCREPNSNLLAAGVMKAQELQPYEGAELYACFLANGNETLRKIVATAVGEMGPEVKFLVRKALERKGAYEALRFLAEWDARTREGEGSRSPEIRGTR